MKIDPTIYHLSAPRVPPPTDKAAVRYYLYTSDSRRPLMRPPRMHACRVLADEEQISGLSPQERARLNTEFLEDHVRPLLLARPTPPY